MVAEMHCVTSSYQMELGSGEKREWYLSSSVVGITESHRYTYYGVIMIQFIVDSWNGVMNAERNPLRHIPDLNTRHMVLQVLAWMWCIAFAMYFGSMWIFGITAIAHVILIAAIVFTVATFETAKRNPTFFLKSGYHTPSRARTIWVDGKKIEDPYGGEHE